MVRRANPADIERTSIAIVDEGMSRRDTKSYDVSDEDKYVDTLPETAKLFASGIGGERISIRREISGVLRTLSDRNQQDQKAKLENPR